VDKRKPANVQELWQFIGEEWQNLQENEELLQNLVHSMPKRIQAVINAKGYATDY